MGTLVRLEDPVEPLRRELAERFDIRLTPEEARAGLAAEISFYRRALDLGRDSAGLEDLRRRCAAVLREALPASERLARVPLPALTQALLAALRFSAYEDAAPTLRAWRARGTRAVVVSNWDVSLHDVLERVGLTPLLDGVVTSAEVGRRKPAPEPFRIGLALAEAVPHQALHVGDSLEEDVAGARAAGIEAVLLSRPEWPPADVAPGPGVRVVRSLRELQAVAGPEGP